MKTWKVIVTDDVQDDLDNFVYESLNVDYKVKSLKDYLMDNNMISSLKQKYSYSELYSNVLDVVNSSLILSRVK